MSQLGGLKQIEPHFLRIREANSLEASNSWRGLALYHHPPISINICDLSMSPMSYKDNSEIKGPPYFWMTSSLLIASAVTPFLNKAAF